MPEPVEWLDDEQQRAWRSFLEATRLLFDALERQLQSDSGITHGYYEILVRLSEAPGHTLRMSELADSSLSSRSRLSHAVSRLEEHGWVRRESCPSDGRGLLAVLTPAGMSALEAAAPGHVAAVRRHLVDALGAGDLRELGRISAVLRDRMAGEATHDTGCTGGVDPEPQPSASDSSARA